MPKGIEKSLQGVLGVSAHSDTCCLKAEKTTGSVNRESIALESSWCHLSPRRYPVVESILEP